MSGDGVTIDRGHEEAREKRLADINNIVEIVRRLAADTSGTHQLLIFSKEGNEYYLSPRDAMYIKELEIRIGVLLDNGYTFLREEDTHISNAIQDQSELFFKNNFHVYQEYLIKRFHARLNI